jgi:AcrR family transcriptional regulator
MRADARENRARILDVARAELDAGRTPTMAAVAEQAGVGKGTLYRHFTTWQDLVLEVHRSDMAELAAAAPGLLASLPPLEAMRSWLARLAEYGRLKRGLSDAMHAALRTQGEGGNEPPDIGAIDLILEAGRADGSMRDDISGQDVLLLVGFLWRLDLTPDRDERSARLLDVVLQGLRRARLQDRLGETLYLGYVHQAGKRDQLAAVRVSVHTGGFHGRLRATVDRSLQRRDQHR